MQRRSLSSVSLNVLIIIAFSPLSTFSPSPSQSVISLSLSGFSALSSMKLVIFITYISIIRIFSVLIQMWKRNEIKRDRPLKLYLPIGLKGESSDSSVILEK